MSEIKMIKNEVLYHFLFWGLVLFYPYIKYLGREGGYPMTFLHEVNALVFNMLASYVLYLWFFPIEKKWKRLPFILIILVLISMLHFYFDGFFHSAGNHALWKEHVSNFVGYASFGTVFLTLYTAKKVFYKQKQIDQMRLEVTSAQLKMLKAQINPHYLFNTLNTLYSSALNKEEGIPAHILKLSNTLRYFLYEGEKDYISLEDEILHLKEYIDLQQYRLGKKIKVNWHENVDQREAEIPSLLLIPIVENAFKYTSVLEGMGHEITFELRLEGNKFSFTSKNPLNENTNRYFEKKWKESGIGLKNIQKRLQLMFPNRHTLKIEKKVDYFKCKVSLVL